MCVLFRKKRALQNKLCLIRRLHPPLVSPLLTREYLNFSENANNKIAVFSPKTRLLFSLLLTLNPKALAYDETTPQ